MEENKIIDTEYTEIPAEEEKIEVDLSTIAPEDMMDLLDDVNHLVNGYCEIFAATRHMMHMLRDKGYEMDKVVGLTNVLCKRASDKAAMKVNEAEEKPEKTTEDDPEKTTEDDPDDDDSEA